MQLSVVMMLINL